jgi:hypothetical protein
MAGSPRRKTPSYRWKHVVLEGCSPRGWAAGCFRALRRRRVVRQHHQRLLAVSGDVESDGERGFRQNLLAQQSIARLDKQQFGLRPGAVKGALVLRGDADP